MVNRQITALKELDSLVKSDRLGKVLDVLEPRAERLAKQPSAVSFGVLFGAVFVVLGIFAAQLGANYIHLSPVFQALLIPTFLAAGVALGNLLAIGRRGLRLERKGRAIERFVSPLVPLVIKVNQKPATKELGAGLMNAITTELGPPATQAKQLLSATSIADEPVPE